jgi:hypothetical protein
VYTYPPTERCGRALSCVGWGGVTSGGLSMAHSHSSGTFYCPFTDEGYRLRKADSQSMPSGAGSKTSDPHSVLCSTALSQCRSISSKPCWGDLQHGGAGMWDKEEQGLGTGLDWGMAWQQLKILYPTGSSKRGPVGGQGQDTRGALPCLLQGLWPATLPDQLSPGPVPGF